MTTITPELDERIQTNAFSIFVFGLFVSAMLGLLSAVVWRWLAITMFTYLANGRDISGHMGVIDTVALIYLSVAPVLAPIMAIKLGGWSVDKVYEHGKRIIEEE